MKTRLPRAAAVLAGLLIISQLTAGVSIKKKEEAVASVERHEAEIIDLSDRVWGFAETALRRDPVVDGARGLRRKAGLHGRTRGRGNADRVRGELR